MNRRQLLKGALLGASALALGAPGPAWPGVPAETGRLLKIVRRTIEVKGRAARVFGLEQRDGKPGLALQAGDLFDVVLRNETDEPTIVHWHGLTPPWESDGVADAPLPLLAPRAERRFRFPVGAAGTHWMHAHTLQAQALLAAPLIVGSADDPARDEQEVVVLLHDFSFSSPEELFARLRPGKASPVSGMPGGAGMTMGPGGGHGDMSGHVSMSARTHGAMPMDLNDIDYDAYLANDRTLDDPEIAPVERAGRVRLRIINGAAATAFIMDFGELEGVLVAVDGQEVEPVKGRRFPLSMGQRIDVRLDLPGDARAFPVLALREGARERTGLILRPPGAPVARIASLGSGTAPALDLTLEAQLRALGPLAPRQADRAFATALAGDMDGYDWALQTDAPIVAPRGARVEIVMRNDSMMAHPMHLHGHHFQVVAIDGRRFAGAVRDTVHVPPQRSVTVAVDAGNPGDWAFHCHHLYHMAAGMMTRFAYAA